MSIPDIFNGVYEFTGGLMIWSNVAAIYKDKCYAGIRIPVMAFFTSWSLWNLYYYPHLNQWVSFAGGLNIGLANLAFVGCMIHYGRGNGKAT